MPQTRELNATAPEIRDLLKEAQTIAVVGLSDKPDRDSYRVAEYLQSQGYQIIPVNPAVTEVLGERSYATLAEVPGPIDIVDIFRRSEAVPPIVDDAIGKGAKAVWMQLGVGNQAAAEKARAAGLRVVMDKCIMVEHRRL